MIDQTVKFGKDIHLGDYVVIEKGVVIGNDVSIGNHVIIKEGTVIGDGVSIDDFTLVGKLPAKSKGMARQPNLKLSPLIIDRHVNIGSHTIIYRDRKSTRLNSSHVAVWYAGFFVNTKMIRGMHS